MESNSIFEYAPSADPNCKNCQKQVHPTERYCTDCGFPMNASEEEENQFYYKLGAKKLQLQELDRKIKNAKTTLWVIAGLTFLGGLLMYFMLQDSHENALVILITNTIVALLFLGLAELAKQKPFIALLSALILYVTLFLYGVVVEEMSPMSGIIIRIIIVVYLIKGINSASEAEKIKKEINA